MKKYQFTNHRAQMSSDGSNKISIFEDNDLGILLGDLPLMPGDDEEMYRKLIEHVEIDLAPRDLLEQVWIRDYCDLTIDVLRYRRMRPSILRNAEVDVLKFMLKPLVDAETIDLAVNNWRSNDAARRSEVVSLLQEHGLTTFDLTTRAFTARLPQLQQVENLCGLAEKRRNASYQEILRHRAAFAYNLHDSVREAEKAIYLEIDNSDGVGSSPSNVTGKSSVTILDPNKDSRS